MMVGTDLGEAIRSAMGLPLPLSSQLIGWGNAVVSHIDTSAIVTNDPGTVTGIAPPNGGDLIDGAADDGRISGLSGSVLASLVATDAGYGFVSGRLLIFCTEIVNHIQNLGRVQFAIGNIIGNCSNTVASPGVLTGSGHDGFVKLLDGTVLANAIHAAEGYPGSTSTRLIEFCTGLVNYIMSHAVASYANGNVTAVCPADGGPITDGAGSNGTIV